MTTIRAIPGPGLPPAAVDLSNYATRPEITYQYVGSGVSRTVKDKA